MILKKGCYKTRCGYDAVVGNIKQINNAFIARGAIVEPFSEVLMLYMWNMNGDSLDPRKSSFDFDLVAEAE